MNPWLHPYVVTGFLTSAVTLVVGLFVYLQDRQSPTHRAFLFFSITIWEWSFFTALAPTFTDVQWVLFFSKICHIGGMLIPIFFYYFTLKIIGREKKLSFVSGILIAISLIILNFTTSLFLPGTRQDVGLPNYARAGEFYWIMVVYFCSYVILAIFHLWNEIRMSTGSRKKHLNYFFIASVVGFGIGVVNFFPLFGITLPPYPYSASCGAIYSSVIAYAILRHKLFNIELIVKKSIVFGLLFITVYGLVSSLIFFVSYFLARDIPSLLSGISIVIAMVIYEPLKGLLTHLTHGFLYQKKTDYASLIQALTDKVANVTNDHVLADEITAFLTEHMSLEWAGLYLKDSNHPNFSLRSKSNSLAFAGLELPETDPIVGLVKKRKKLLILSPFDIEASLDQETKVKLRQDKIEGIAPIFLQDNLFGILLLGKKKSDDAFTQEDEALLETLAEEIAMYFLSAKLVKDATRSNLEVGQSLKMTAVTKLARGVHHEVRNPLHEIDLYAVAAAKTSRKAAIASPSASVTDSAKSNIQNVIRLMVQNIMRIKTSLGRFAQFARPEADIELRAVSLHLELSKFLALMEEGQRLDHIKVHNLVPENIVVLAGEGILQEILFNLFDNACQAMDEKGELFLEAHTENGFVIFKMRDTGPGIQDDILPSIFNPYFTTKTNSEAVGIGLSIVKHYVERLGGTIEVGNGSGGGAEFRVKLKHAVKAESLNAA